MTLAADDRSPIIQINHLRVAPDDQDELLALMTEQLDANMATQPGFISSRLHKGRDGRNIVNYVLFETKAQLDAAHERPEFKAQFEKYKHLVIEAGPVLYDVVVERGRTPDAYR
jgi:heme-degrading monooxygenase HmoA